MDFAIAIRDVFTAILRFVAGAPPLPVKDHPDEFWEFIRRNNRVLVLGQPSPEDDYPLYSAYPGTTVLDVIGPRTQLPPPVADRAAHASIERMCREISWSATGPISRGISLSVGDASKARSWIAARPRGVAGWRAWHHHGRAVEFSRLMVSG